MDACIDERIIGLFSLYVVWRLLRHPKSPVLFLSLIILLRYSRNGIFKFLLSSTLTLPTRHTPCLKRTFLQKYQNTLFHHIFISFTFLCYVACYSSDVNDLSVFSAFSASLVELGIHMSMIVQLLIT